VRFVSKDEAEAGHIFCLQQLGAEDLIPCSISRNSFHVPEYTFCRCLTVVRHAPRDPWRGTSWNPTICSHGLLHEPHRRVCNALRAGPPVTGKA
jgi:hypothetical protein